MSVENDAQLSAAPAEAPAPAAPVANPGLLALPAFIVGSISLALWLVGYLPPTVPGGLIAAVFVACGIGVFAGGIWAARAGQSAVGGIFGMFGLFWLSFGFLLFGLVNGLFGVSSLPLVAAVEVQKIQATFLIAWLVVFVVATLATLRLPLAFTAMFVLVDAAVALVLGGVLAGSTALLTWGGIAAFAFALDGLYIYYVSMSGELGGSAMSLGNPVLK